MEISLKNSLLAIASAVRSLSIEAVQKADSGHPGMPMGCAELGAFLFGAFLRYNPENPHWMGRDRLVLSAGHGSMWLYSLLHLAGFDLSIEEIKRFRQLGSKPGHPEYGMTPGVEVTTGPLGQGVANGVGMALGLQLLKGRFPTEGFCPFDGKVVVVAGDGCMMEGISSEASSLAGHLGLSNLICLYDANDISLDGKLSESCSEDTKMRYEAYGWEVHQIDGYDLDGMETLFRAIRACQRKPVLILVKTIIGKGSPNKAGTHKVHGSPLGKEEVAATKKALHLPEEDFAVLPEVKAFFAKKKEEGKGLEREWAKEMASFEAKHPEWMQMKGPLPDLSGDLATLQIPSPIAGRAASQAVLQMVSEKVPSLYGGSADLSCSDLTWLKNFPMVAKGDFKGRNIKFGVREFAMAAMANGLSTIEGIRPYIGTFLTFSDYMRNAIRLAALSHYPVIYQFTHDSVFLGEDGPTHQPVEHLASLRAMPNLHVIRPADSAEVKMAWRAALEYKGPTALILSRQALPEIAATHIPYAEGMAKGAYFVRKSEGAADFTLIATGSEVSLALSVADLLQTKGKKARVISMPCTELFDKQPKSYRDKLLKEGAGKLVSIEAATTFGWHRYIGSEGIAIGIDTFGHSAPIKDLAESFGFTKEAIAAKLLG